MAKPLSLSTIDNTTSIFLAADAAPMCLSYIPWGSRSRNLENQQTRINNMIHNGGILTKRPPEDITIAWLHAAPVSPLQQSKQMKPRRSNCTIREISRSKHSLTAADRTEPCQRNYTASTFPRSYQPALGPWSSERHITAIS